MIAMHIEHHAHSGHSAGRQMFSTGVVLEFDMSSMSTCVEYAHAVQMLVSEGHFRGI